ncbi:MAG: DUF4105 domain-containing protein [Aquaticitalea sp.]
MKLKLFLLSSVLFTTLIFAQTYQLSPNAEISVLTIGPGDNLNDAFGHNAFRINDSSVGMDVVYGYGEYDFDTPNFYLKFAQGKLNYKMNKSEFSDFYRCYQFYNRTIEQQTLNLSASEKQRLYDYLINNYKPENRKYLYDFFYDNCATRIRDVAENSSGNKIDFKMPDNFESKTFRQLIYDHTGRNNWGSFGIDLALGSVIDRPATAYEFMFLPKYIHQFFGSAVINSSTALVKKSDVIYQRRASSNSNNFLFSPLMVFGIISSVILYLTYLDYKNNKRNKWLDVILFAITGILGILILLLWFATDHSATAQNYNLLWALPLNLLVLGQLIAPQVKNWFRNYLKFLLIMLFLLTFHWIMGIQVYALGLIPLLITLGIRYLFLLNHFGKSESY